MKINHLTPGTVNDIQRILQLWEIALAKYKGNFLFGEFSLVDAFYAPVVMRFISYGIEIKSRPIQNYKKRVQAHPIVMEWLKKAKREKIIRLKF